MHKATSGVEFSLNKVMYRQTDGVAVGSPLGLVLANIFVGFYEQRLPLDDSTVILLYKRYVDDTFSLNISVDYSQKFLTMLNSLHPALQFSWEQEQDGRLPFLDNWVTFNLLVNQQIAPPNTVRQHLPDGIPDGTHFRRVNRRLIW